MANHIVNDLIESLSNATGPAREPAAVGRLLAYCEQKCYHWHGECECHDREEWIRLLITPGERCTRFRE